MGVRPAADRQKIASNYECAAPLSYFIHLCSISLAFPSVGLGEIFSFLFFSCDEINETAGSTGEKAYELFFCDFVSVSMMRDRHACLGGRENACVVVDGRGGPGL